MALKPVLLPISCVFEVVLSMLPNACQARVVQMLLRVDVSTIPVVSAAASDLHGRRECRKMYGTLLAMLSTATAASYVDSPVSTTNRHS